jgi:hypothetical protein
MSGINIVPTPENVTLENASDYTHLLGIKRCDINLPEGYWLSNLREMLHDRHDRELAAASFVWAYDTSRNMGRPYPLTVQAYSWLRLYDREKGSRYADGIFNVLDIA